MGQLDPRLIKSNINSNGKLKNHTFTEKRITVTVST